MKCHRARALFSSYLDGAMPGVEMQAVASHLHGCAQCRAEYAAWQRAQQLVSELRPKAAPPELALRLRVALSNAAAQNPHRFGGVLVHLENFADAFMLPVTAGLVSAVIFFFVLIGFLALPGQLSAASDDVPTMLYTPPQLQALPPNMGLSSENSDLVVETLVDANGRVQDYHILSGPSDARMLEPELNNIMIFTTFRPATTFGVRTPGKVVLSFAKINVRG
jgi:hypothetical protein